MIVFDLFVLGLCLGSFVNALVWRLHEKQLLAEMPAKMRAKATIKAQELSIIKGRSMCPNCHHTLAVMDLLPVVSWLSLGGKCRYCKTTISWQYPLVEVAGGALFAVSYWWWPEPLHKWLLVVQFAVWLLIVVLLLAMTVYDLRWMLLPDRLVGITAALAAVFAMCGVVAGANWSGTVWGMLWGAVFGGGLFYVLFQVSDGKWIGGGDVKLGAALGVLVGGPLNALVMLFLASFLGTFISLPLLATKRLQIKGRLPFGPFLIAAAFILVLNGSALIDWYEFHFLV